MWTDDDQCVVIRTGLLISPEPWRMTRVAGTRPDGLGPDDEDTSPANNRVTRLHTLR